MLYPGRDAVSVNGPLLTRPLPSNPRRTLQRPALFATPVTRLICGGRAALRRACWLVSND